jgi:hypothetical protein
VDRRSLFKQPQHGFHPSTNQLKTLKTIQHWEYLCESWLIVAFFTLFDLVSLGIMADLHRALTNNPFDWYPSNIPVGKDKMPLDFRSLLCTKEQRSDKGLLQRGG